MDFDLTTLTITQVVSLTVVVTVIDVAAAIVLAMTKGTFSLAYVALWLQSHVAPRVFPIFALAWLGHGVPAFDVPAIPPLFGLAIGGLTAYVLETVKSVSENFRTGAPPPPVDETPVPPAG